MFAPLAAGMEVCDMAWEVKCREEDMKHRAVENERRLIDDARRAVDEKSQQLKALSHLSALIAGFAMVVLVEISIPATFPGPLLLAFGVSASSVIAMMLVSMLNATLMLVAINKYDCIRREMPFVTFWRKRCEADFVFALRAFVLGVPVFICVLGLVGWTVFWDRTTFYRMAGGSSVTAVAVATVVFWFSHTERKWVDWIVTTGNNASMFNPDA